MKRKTLFLILTGKRLENIKKYKKDNRYIRFLFEIRMSVLFPIKDGVMAEALPTNLNV